MTYFDPNGLARSNGFVEGLNNGRAEGKKAGYNSGYSNGHQVGYHSGYQAGYQNGQANGWDTGIATGNENMLEQMGYTRVHVAEKEALAAQLEHTRALLTLANERLALLERTQAQDEPVAVLRDADLDKMKQLQQLHADRCRDTVFLNAACSTLEELAMTEGEMGHATWDALDNHYHQKVEAALATATLTTAPHLDPGFAQAHPKAQQLLAAMLRDAPTD
jgi:hypothetical protein